MLQQPNCIQQIQQYDKLYESYSGLHQQDKSTYEYALKRASGLFMIQTALWQPTLFPQCSV